MSQDPMFQRRALAIVAAAEEMTRVDGGEPDDDFASMDASALASEIVEAWESQGVSPAGGAPSYLADHPRLVTLLRALASGNYRETAADLAMIHPRTVQLWCERGEKEPDGVYGVVCRIIRHAEAVAEASARHRITEAGKLPHLWTANAWTLERKHPDRWAKKPEDRGGPGVVITIGGTLDDVMFGHKGADNGDISYGAHIRLPAGTCGTLCSCRKALPNATVVDAVSVTHVSETGTPESR